MTSGQDKYCIQLQTDQGNFIAKILGGKRLIAQINLFTSHVKAYFPNKNRLLFAVERCVINSSYIIKRTTKVVLHPASFSVVQTEFSYANPSWNQNAEYLSV